MYREIHETKQVSKNPNIMCYSIKTFFSNKTFAYVMNCNSSENSGSGYTSLFLWIVTRQSYKVGQM